ncbi:DUF488 domain-containing protein [Arhodomonas aquaeolei]|uniref:DUF488 domain-containing protein n=1 Tax=Arhodomonas TaxID=2368 RepID=UPI0013D61855|nr:MULTISPECIES: DUF488 domain-containing protein [Arhodomonas]MCS4505509.1 DUF488 domain-containing protein [Arhodomonas aquaeolei]
MSRLFTIGYERASLAAFTDTLTHARVSVLVDVRLSPHSRRREFALKHLGAGMAERGIRYLSRPDLGTPPPAQAAAKAGDMATFERLYREHLDTAVARDALAELAGLVEGEVACVMCYERDPKRCHRRLIAETLRRRDGILSQDLLPPR